MDGHQCYVIAYDYNSNYIDVMTVSDLQDETTADMAIKKMDHQPRLSMTDNQAAHPLKAYIFENLRM